MIQMFYDYNTECTTQHSTACYYADINNPGKTWLSFLLVNSALGLMA